MSEENRRRRPDVVADMLKTVFVPVHREGWPFIGLFAAVAVALGFAYGPLGWIGALATAWCVYFFRDPERFPPPRDDVVLSPADGVVLTVGEASPPADLDMGADPMMRISIFLNVFDVHVNRVPADGTVIRAVYHPGKFLNASLDKASDENERMAIALRLPDDRMMAFVQVAGLVARRIKCDLTEGQYVTAGERYGIIRFGSRADLYLPAGVTPLVAVGQRMIGGETVLAELASAGDE